MTYTRVSGRSKTKVVFCQGNKVGERESFLGGKETRSDGASGTQISHPRSSSPNMCSPSQAKDIKKDLKSILFCKIPVLLLQNPFTEVSIPIPAGTHQDLLGGCTSLSEPQIPRLAPGFSKLLRHRSTPVLGINTLFWSPAKFGAGNEME